MPRYDWQTQITNWIEATRFNLQRNPSFEVAAINWSGSVGAPVTLTRVTTNVFSGSWALELKTPSGGGGRIFTSLGSGEFATAGRSYTFSAYVRVTAGVARDHSITLNWLDINGTLISQSNGNDVLVSTTYTRIHATGVAPANAYRIQVVIVFNDDEITDYSTNIDALLLEETNTVKPYFDGNTPPATTSTERNFVTSWVGVTDQSASKLVYEQGAIYSLSNVTSLNITKGRSQIQDPFKAGTALVQGRVPTSLPNFLVGDEVNITVSQGIYSVVMFNGLVADYQINYGIAQGEDTWEITCEDALALAGRALTSDVAELTGGDTTFVAAQTMAATGDVNVVNLYSTTSGSVVSQQDIETQNVLNVLNTLVATEQGRIVAASVNSIGWVDRTAFNLIPFVAAFTDETVSTALPAVRFSDVVFSSKADSYFTRVVTQPEDLDPQEAGSGFRTFTLTSYDDFESQAKSLAEYVLQTLNVNIAAPLSVDCVSERQTNNAVVEAALYAGGGVRANLILRGNTYDVFIEGATINVDLSQTRFSFNIVSSDAQNVFVLDSTTNGLLNVNKLGF